MSLKIIQKPLLYQMMNLKNFWKEDVQEDEPSIEGKRDEPSQSLIVEDEGTDNRCCNQRRRSWTYR